MHFQSVFGGGRTDFRRFCFLFSCLLFEIRSIVHFENEFWGGCANDSFKKWGDRAFSANLAAVSLVYYDEIDQWCMFERELYRWPRR